MTEKPDERPEEIEESVEEMVEEPSITEEAIPEPTATEKKAPKKGQKGKSKDKEKRKIRPSHVAVAVLAAALIGTLVYFLWPAAEEDWDIIDGPVPMGGRGTVAIPENIDELMRNREEPPPGGHYITTMNNNWAFEKWNAPSTNAYVENDIRNEYTVYFDLALEEDNRLVYSSPYIPQGATLRSFALDRTVSAGEHSAIVTYYLVDEDGSEVSRVSVRVTLTIAR